MDTKKVIGAIIGIGAFVALIAGATFAWLSNTVGITNGTAALGTTNFYVNYTKASNITSIKVTASPSPSTTTLAQVTAGLGSSSVPGTITIYLNRTSTANAIVNNGFLKYSYCVGTCSGTTFADNTGTVGTGSKVALVSGEQLSSSAQNYNIYLWIDDSVDTSSIAGLKFAGNITATATQTE